MSEIETRLDERIEQSFFECPFCGRSQLLTRRLANAEQLHESASNRLFYQKPKMVEKYSF